MARLDDGFSTLTTFSLNGSVKIYEKTVKPTGRDSGGAIPTSTMHNTRFRTKAPKQLMDVTDGSVKFAYDVGSRTQLDAMIGKPQTITYHYPDGATEVIQGWIDKTEYDDLEEGTQPTGTITIISGNQNGAGAETAPTYTTPGATTTTTTVA